MVELQRLGAEGAVSQSGQLHKSKMYSVGMGWDSAYVPGASRQKELMRQSYEAGVDGMTVNFSGQAWRGTLGHRGRHIDEKGAGWTTKRPVADRRKGERGMPEQKNRQEWFFKWITPLQAMRLCVVIVIVCMCVAFGVGGSVVLFTSEQQRGYV